MEFRASNELIVKAMQSRKTRAELRKMADRKARRVNQIGSAEKVEMNATVTEGTRPKGRPYARVESKRVDQEWGNRNTKRRRILGRVAEER